MRNSWLLAFCLLVSLPSFAMQKKKECPIPTPPPESCNTCQDLCKCDRWTGFTVGFNVAALINDSKGSLKPVGDFKLPENQPNNPQRTASFDMGGTAFATGVQLGYNYQLKVLVLGLETDFNYSMLDQKHKKTKDLSAPLTGTFQHKMSDFLNWFGTFRGRFGYTFKVPVLIYGTGGFAYGHPESKTSVRFSSDGSRYKGSGSDWKIGWTAGAGIEWGFARHWSLKTEYLYLKLREQHYTDTNRPLPAHPTYSYHSELETGAHLVRLGFNYTI